MQKYFFLILLFWTVAPWAEDAPAPFADSYGVLLGDGDSTDGFPSEDGESPEEEDVGEEDGVDLENGPGESMEVLTEDPNQ